MAVLLSGRGPLRRRVPDRAVEKAVLGTGLPPLRMRVLKAKRADFERLWPDSHEQMLQQLADGITHLGLGTLNLKWYSARHGGASHDLAMKLRDAAGVKRRLRHVGDMTVRFYGRSGKLARAAHLMPDLTLQFGVAVDKRLGEVLKTGALPSALPAARPSN